MAWSIERKNWPSPERCAEIAEWAQGVPRFCDALAKLLEEKAAKDKQEEPTNPLTGPDRPG